MGWNDHVDYVETECLRCGVIQPWEYWSEVGQQRYVGKIGEMVGVDATKHNTCPKCGWKKGRMVEEDDD
jgi:ribosomal protein S27AE